MQSMKSKTKRRSAIYVMGRRKTKSKHKQQTVNNTICPPPPPPPPGAIAINNEEVESSSSSSIYTSSLSNKYQPKLFQDIVGQNIVIKTLSNAVRQKKIAPLYLFHGPNGTGKTSTARVFALALNCESSFHNKKPCGSCKGCTRRSLYAMELRSSGFNKNKSLLHKTCSLAPGMKVVFVVEECHLLSLEAWEELMSLLEGPYGSNLVFVLITSSTDPVSSMINGDYITSRCQKFYFTKLNDDDVTKKLSTILVHECVKIEKEALKLIVAKSQGSLRNAESILDQLTLLASTITTSMTQQLVGLVPQTELLDLVAMAVSGDTINTIRHAKKLSGCIEPASFVSQLTNLITNVLLSESGFSSSSANQKLLKRRSRLSRTHTRRLCYILKLLVGMERQLRSSTVETSNVVIAAALLDMTNSVKPSNTKIVLPKSQRSSSLSEIALHSDEHDQTIDAKRGSLSDTEELWKDLLKGVESSRIQKFLRDRAKLALLSISRTKAVAHLTFTRPEDKMAAEISEASLAKSLEFAIGCPVTLHMSLEPPILEQNNGKSIISSGSHYSQKQNTNRNGEGLRLTKSKSCSTSHRSNRYSANGRGDLNTVQVQNLTRVFEKSTSDAKDPQSTNLIDSKYTRANKPKHRWLSLSSIPQSDASVEPYSQDVNYANFNKDGDDATRKKTPKLQKRLSKSYKETADQLKPNPSWCC